MIFPILFGAALVAAHLLFGESEEEQEKKEIMKEIKKSLPDAKNVNIQINVYNNCTFNNHTFNSSPLSLLDFSNSEIGARKQFNYLDQGLRYGIGDKYLEALNQPTRIRMLDSGSKESLNDILFKIQRDKDMKDMERWFSKSEKKK